MLQSQVYDKVITKPHMHLKHISSLFIEMMGIANGVGRNSLIDKYIYIYVYTCVYTYTIYI